MIQGRVARYKEGDNKLLNLKNQNCCQGAVLAEISCISDKVEGSNTKLNKMYPAENYSISYRLVNSNVGISYLASWEL